MNVIEATRTGDPPDELDPRERMSELIDLDELWCLGRLAHLYHCEL